jgi:hypothetical protein
MSLIKSSNGVVSRTLGKKNKNLANSDVSEDSLSHIGDLKHSMLTEAQLNANGGEGKWLLCNGQSCANTLYEKITLSATVPDLITERKFLRAAFSEGTIGSTETDNAKTNGLSVSGGTSSLTGTTTFAKHTHYHNQGTLTAAAEHSSGTLRLKEVTGSTHTYNASFALAYSGAISFPSTTGIDVLGNTGNNSHSASVGISSTAASLSGTSSTETRPTNMAVNIFIKVN